MLDYITIQLEEKNAYGTAVTLPKRQQQVNSRAW